MQAPPEDAGRDQAGRRSTRIALAVIVCGAVLFPMLAGKSADARQAMAFWLVSPVLVTLGLGGYANFYLGRVGNGSARGAWVEAAHDFAASTRFITVVAAICYLLGFFLDPNSF